MIQEPPDKQTLDYLEQLQKHLSRIPTKMVHISGSEEISTWQTLIGQTIMLFHTPAMARGQGWGGGG